jgi:hypothetical protein
MREGPGSPGPSPDWRVRLSAVRESWPWKTRARYHRSRTKKRANRHRDGHGQGDLDPLSESILERTPDHLCHRLLAAHVVRATEVQVVHPVVYRVPDHPHALGLGRSPGLPVSYRELGGAEAQHGYVPIEAAEPPIPHMSTRNPRGAPRAPHAPRRGSRPGSHRACPPTGSRKEGGRIRPRR